MVTLCAYLKKLQILSSTVKVVSVVLFWWNCINIKNIESDVYMGNMRRQTRSMATHRAVQTHTHAEIRKCEHGINSMNREKANNVNSQLSLQQAKAFSNVYTAHTALHAERIEEIFHFLNNIRGKGSPYLLSVHFAPTMRSRSGKGRSNLRRRKEEENEEKTANWNANGSQINGFMHVASV